ncbi:MAG: hypothetical protein KBC42_00635 [Candidatus Pacebacteria bacterium]|nr:hypothetical protein [Candidatus Paceibacterota bacterium]MBP9780414.1 hypothetical protein [Candidatus Paceibacterota bacterium]
MKDSGLTTEVQTSTRFTIVPLISISDQVSVGNTTLVVRLTDIGMFEKNHRDSIGMLDLHRGSPSHSIHIGLGHHLHNSHSEAVLLLQKLRSSDFKIKSVTGLCVGKTPENISEIAHLKNSDAHVLIKEASLPRDQHANFLLGIVTQDSTGKSISNKEFWNLSDMVSKTLQNCFPEVIIC